MDAPTLQHAGPEVLHVEGELLVVRPRGRMETEAVQTFVEQIKQLYSLYGQYFLLVDLSHASDLSPGLRRMLAENEAWYPPAAAAFCGGNANARGMNALFQGAIVAFGGRRRKDEYFGTEQEARAWLKEERRRLKEESTSA